ncbi:MAG: DUF4494 family protein [Bacteroidetes bacterium]|nr:DUF4494 family protein [Bacteroidota bacterium]
MTYYEVRVKVEIDGVSGKTKNVNEIYLIKAVSVTDAEAIINEHFKDVRLTFEVVGVKLTSIIEVLNDN